MVSSANILTLPEGQHLGRSLIKSKKNKGPRTDPWGTPHVMGLVFDLQLSMFTYCSQSIRKLFKSSCALTVIPRFSTLSSNKS